MSVFFWKKLIQSLSVKLIWPTGVLSVLDVKIPIFGERKPIVAGILSYCSSTYAAQISRAASAALTLRLNAKTNAIETAQVYPLGIPI